MIDLLVVEAEFSDSLNCFYFHHIWPGLQEGRIMSRVQMQGFWGKVWGTFL